MLACIAGEVYCWFMCKPCAWRIKFIWKDFAWSITINNFIICNRNSAITILIRTWLKKSMLNKASVTFGEGNNGFEVPGKSQFSKFLIYISLTVPESMV